VRICGDVSSLAFSAERPSLGHSLCLDVPGCISRVSGTHQGERLAVLRSMTSGQFQAATYHSSNFIDYGLN